MAEILTVLNVPTNKVELTAEPKILAVILTKDNVHLLKSCVETLLKEDYENLKIVIGDTGSSNASVREIVSFIANRSASNIPIIYENIGVYHFSTNNNDLIKKYSDGSDLILFLNNDIEFIPNNFALRQMVQHYNENKETVGTVGLQLLFGGTKEVQHQGVFPLYNRDNNTMMVGHTNYRTYKYIYDNKEVFGNTGACMLMSMELFNDIGGFNTNYKSVFQDVELNIECLIRGKVNTCLNTAIAYHKESSTRKKSSSDERKDNDMLQEDLKMLSPYMLQNAGVVTKYLANKTLKMKTALTIWANMMQMEYGLYFKEGAETPIYY